MDTYATDGTYLMYSLHELAKAMGSGTLGAIWLYASSATYGEGWLFFVHGVHESKIWKRMTVACIGSTTERTLVMNITYVQLKKKIFSTNRSHVE